MAHDANQRWDNLQKRVASILRRLKVQTFLPFVMLVICICYDYTTRWCGHSNCSFSVSNTQHFISQREEFETARDGILVWLTEMDLQLTNIEHFSECDIQAKIKQLRVGLSQYSELLHEWRKNLQPSIC